MLLLIAGHPGHLADPSKAPHLWSNAWAVTHTHTHRETDIQYPNKDDRGNKGQEKGALELLSSADRSKREIVWGQNVPYASLLLWLPKPLTASLPSDQLYSPLSLHHPNLPCLCPFVPLTAEHALIQGGKSALRCERRIVVFMVMVDMATDTQKMLPVITGQSGKWEHVCVLCLNLRCKSAVEVVQGRVWYSTQLCLTAL